MLCLYCTRTPWEGFNPTPPWQYCLLWGSLSGKQQNSVLCLEGWQQMALQILNTFTMPKVPGSQSLLCFAHTVQGDTHLKPVLLSVLIPGLNRPTNCSDLAEKFYKGRQMSKSCCLHSLQQSLRKLGGAGCAKAASPLPCSRGWRMQSDLEMMQTHLGQPGDVGFISIYC